MKIIETTQGSEEWLAMRLGMITGTRLKSAIGSPAVRKTLIYELVAEQVSGLQDKLWVNEAMQWGTDHEDEAVEVYEKQTKIKTSVVGFCRSEEYDYLALSPDRLVKKGKKWVGAVEVKCPGTKTFVKYMADGGIPAEYMGQVTNYFLVNPDLEWLDFVIYDPRVKMKKKRAMVTRITRKEVDTDEAADKLKSFRQEWKEVYDKVTK